MPETRNLKSETRAKPHTAPESKLAPLKWFFQDQPLPPVEVVAAIDVPAPYRGLLVNRRDMTSTLERHYQDRMLIRVIQKQVVSERLCREVVLLTMQGQRPVEYGCIIIHLRHFAPEPRARVLECRLPLGGILNQYEIDYRSRPSEYFRIKPGARINAALQQEHGGWLYGRCNSLVNPAGESLADVVEILPVDSC